jgi:hypothetical protein
MSKKDYERRTRSRTPGSSTADPRGARLKKVDDRFHLLKSTIEENRRTRADRFSFDKHLDLMAFELVLRDLAKACQDYIDNHNEPNADLSYSSLYPHRRNGRTRVLEELKGEVEALRAEVVNGLRNYQMLSRPSGPLSGLQVLWPVDLEDL